MKNILRDFSLLIFLFACLAGSTVLRAGESGLNKALELVNEGKTDEAITILRDEIGKRPDEPDTQLLLGVAYLEKSDYDSAKDALEKALALKPDSVPAHYSLAMLFEKEKNYSRASSEWRKVLLLTADKNLKDLASKHIKQLEGKK